jgi:DNA-binding IclR family transcriptional regulator
VQVLARAATILRPLAADSSGGLTLSELVVRARLPRTTVHRNRHALEEEGFVCVDEGTGRLHLGPGLLRLAAASRRDVPAARFSADADSISATLLRVRDEVQIALQGA